MNNLKIGVRLAFGFGVIVVLLIAIAAIGVSRLTALADGTQVIVADKYPQVVLCNTVMNEANKIAQAVRNALLFNDPEQVKQEIAKIRESRILIEGTLPRLGKLVQSNQGHVLFKHVLDTGNTYVVALDQLLKVVNDGQKDQAIEFLTKDMRPVQQSYFDALDKLAAYQTQVMDQAGVDADNQYHAWRTTSIALALLASVAATLIGFLTTRSITRPIGQAMKIAQTVASGDLTSDIVVKTHDETGQLLQALKDMNDSLVRTVGSLLLL